MIKALAYNTAILALDTLFNREMLQTDKFGLFFQKNPNSLKNLINYSEKNPKKIKFLKNSSFKGITIKYEWDFITDSYISEFKSLVSKT